VSSGYKYFFNRVVQKLKFLNNNRHYKERTMRRILFLVFLAASFAGAVWSHEFFVMPGETKDYKAGDTVLLAVLSTHYFTVGEELEPAEVNEVYIVKNGQRAGDSLHLNRNDDRLWHEAGYRLADNSPVIVEGIRKGGFYCVFTDGSYADGTRAEAAAANPDKTVALSEYFAKYAKLYLNPAAKDAMFSVPLGHELEIVPVDNPARIRAGSVSRAKFRVLLRGQPMANAEISATWDYYDYKTANAWAQTTRTDAKGEAIFKIDHGGLWLVRVSDTRPSTRGADTDQLSSVLVFSVK
jgi:uncharacterized GH25 family protein